MIETRWRLSGGCLCGAVRYEAVGPPLWVANCHCAQCRRATGGPFATYAGYPAERFIFTAGKPVSFDSSPGVTRTFCGRCGSSLTYRGHRWPGEVHLLVASLDDPNALSPRAHVFVAEQLVWLHLADDLPRFERTSEGPQR